MLGRFSAALGGGENSILINDTQIQGDLLVKAKKGGDSFEFASNSSVKGNLSVDLAQGDCFAVISPQNGIHDFGGNVTLKCKEAAGDFCGQLIRNVATPGRVGVFSGAAACDVEINDVVFPRLEIDSGAGDDVVTLGAKSFLSPTALFGQVKVQLGKGNDMLQIGSTLDGHAEFQARVLFDGGPGANDTLDHQTPGNVYPVGEPTIKNFETVE